ncbi:hypothetical protein ACYPKM_00350 [Pseudomonas aeruginosa]
MLKDFLPRAISTQEKACRLLERVAVSQILTQQKVAEDSDLIDDAKLMLRTFSRDLAKCEALQREQGFPAGINGLLQMGASEGCIELVDVFSKKSVEVRHLAEITLSSLHPAPRVSSRRVAAYEP